VLEKPDQCQEKLTILNVEGSDSPLSWSGSVL
jgi:hypothetical protein